MIDVRVAIVGVICVLAACHPAPSPTPLIERPTLVRELVVLQEPRAGETVTVSKQAFVQRAGVPGVYVYRDGRARFQMIRVGRTTPTNFEVLSGLQGDETLVIGDLHTVHDGSPIESRK